MPPVSVSGSGREQAAIPPDAYRADIDGLRAVAVLLVVLFHFDVQGFAAGHVGVDVFFVISGYLITRQLLSGGFAGPGGMLRFYARRAARIVPAFAVMLVVTLVACVTIIAPYDAREIAKQISSSALFLSNLLYMRNVDYFFRSEVVRPLLHTWSLSVEEQFYLVYPLLLLGPHRLGPNRSRLLPLALLAGASLAAALVVTRIDSRIAFYGLPTRFWELAAGGMLAIGARGKAEWPAWPRIAAGVGLCLLVLSQVIPAIMKAPFPQPHMLAVAGTVLLIHSGTTGPWTPHRWLSCAPAVLIGRMSYSIYLWHLPVLAAFSYVGPERPGPWSIAAAGAITLALASLSWTCVERPVRARLNRGRPARAIAAAVLVMAVIAVCGTALFLAEGWRGRLSGPASTLADGMIDFDSGYRDCENVDASDLRAGRFCRLAEGGAAAPVLILGDSYAPAMAPGIVAAARAYGHPVELAFRNGCRPGVPDHSEERNSVGACAGFSAALIAGLKQRTDIRTVIVAMRWSPLPNRRVDRFLEANAGNLERLLSAIAAPGRTVWVVAPLPAGNRNIPRMLYLQARGIATDIDPAQTAAGFRDDYDWAFTLLDDLGARGLARIVTVHDAFCDAERCRIRSGDRSLYTDRTHPSIHGAMLLAPSFEPVFRANGKTGPVPPAP
ncbi:MAG: acyltransferase family protein [Pseudomonadota bacterium]|nr:acyltransferase family protein [Pseudomonadota bacterium]